MDYRRRWSTTIAVFIIISTSCNRDNCYLEYSELSDIIIRYETLNMQTSFADCNIQPIDRGRKYILYSDSIYKKRKLLGYNPCMEKHLKEWKYPEIIKQFLYVTFKSKESKKMLNSAREKLDIMYQNQIIAIISTENDDHQRLVCKVFNEIDNEHENYLLIHFNDSVDYSVLKYNGNGFTELSKSWFGKKTLLFSNFRDISERY